MTAADVVRTLVRRWYLTLVGAAASVVLLWISIHQPPVYFTQLDVTLLTPAETQVTNTLREGPYVLAPLAGLIAHDVNVGREVPVTATSTTTLYGEGIHVGERARLRNRGSQWRPVYDAGVIDVQAVGDNPDDVRARAAGLVDELDAALTRRQDAVNLPAKLRVTLQSSPADPVIQQIGPSRSRTAGAVGILGMTSTFLAVVLADRLLGRRRTSRPTPGQASSTDALDLPRRDTELVMS